MHMTIWLAATVFEVPLIEAIAIIGFFVTVIGFFVGWAFQRNAKSDKAYETHDQKLGELARELATVKGRVLAGVSADEANSLLERIRKTLRELHKDLDESLKNQIHAALDNQERLTAEINTVFEKEATAAFDRFDEEFDRILSGITDQNKSKQWAKDELEEKIALILGAFGDFSREKWQKETTEALQEIGKSLTKISNDVDEKSQDVNVYVDRLDVALGLGDGER